VTPELATLPHGWENRLKEIRFGRIRVFCLEVHDFLVSKLAAGRVKDLEVAGAALRLKVGKIEVLRRRIRRVPVEAERLRVRRRLRTVLDKLGHR
jgi:predicted nucleotidyltransferase